MAFLNPIDDGRPLFAVGAVWPRRSRDGHRLVQFNPIFGGVVSGVQDEHEDTEDLGRQFR